MSSIDTEHDLDTLRAMARLLACENERLHKRLAEVVAENADLKGQSAPEQLALELGRLQEQVNRLQKKLFGASSEKRPITDAADKTPDSDSSSESKREKRGHGPTKQTQLEVQPILIELESDDCACVVCGGELKAVDGMTEDSERVTVVERKFVLQQIQRQKYRCDCGIGVTTAPAPPALIPGGRYSLEFAIHVAVDKYLHHLPLDRQRRSMRRQGLLVTTQALWDQIEALARLWTPVYELLREYILGEDVVGVDETWWRYLDKKPSKRWWVWSLACPSAVWYRIAPSRSSKLAASVLQGFSGTIVCDAYSAYETLARGDRELRLALCWAHARRKFVDALPRYAECEQALNLIGELFAIDRDTEDPALLEGDAKLAAAEARRRARAERAPPLLDALRAWALAQRGLPKSDLRRAIDYLLGHWKGLTTFVDDPFVPLDNNRTERALRSVVLGRKNHYGSRSERGTEVAALFYSILETAAQNGVDPARYMRRATYALLNGAPPQAVLPLSSQ